MSKKEFYTLEREIYVGEQYIDSYTVGNLWYGVLPQDKITTYLTWDEVKKANPRNIAYEKFLWMERLVICWSYYLSKRQFKPIHVITRAKRVEQNLSMYELEKLLPYTSYIEFLYDAGFVHVGGAND